MFLKRLYIYKLSNIKKPLVTPLKQILEHRIVAILRGMPPKDIINIASALYNGDHRLGITINEEYVIKMEKEGHNWHNPLWRHPDGCVAEW